jgi:hypothetical protein
VYGQTFLRENDSLGVVNATYNSPSVDKRPFLVNPRTASLLEHQAATAPAAHSL